MLLAEDYIDEDVAYLLGMIVARGYIREGTTKQIIIEIPYTDLETDYEKDRNSLLVSVDRIINRVGELVTNSPRKEAHDNSVNIVFDIHKPTLFWRDIRMLLGDKKDYTEFEVPEQIFIAPSSIQREFIRGFVDVGAKVRKSNEYFGGLRRLHIDVLNPNWKLPIQICSLLQDHLNIPVQNIIWGHPNLRNPKLKKYTIGYVDFWRKEHQIKVFADVFEEIGFYIKHKQDLFMEFVKHNKALNRSSSFCNPPKKVKEKPVHPAESSPKLPSQLQGKHYDSSWQICKDLGCLRCVHQQQISNSDD